MQQGMELDRTVVSNFTVEGDTTIDGVHGPVVRLRRQRLQIEPVSQASANQRQGRCGRTSDGICIRLYSQEDFESRPEFTDPEILRTNLASVILAMTDIGLGDIAAFPFLKYGVLELRADDLRFTAEEAARMVGLDIAGIDSQRRPEELDVLEWGALTRASLAAP